MTRGICTHARPSPRISVRGASEMPTDCSGSLGRWMATFDGAAESPRWTGADGRCGAPSDHQRWCGAPRCFVLACGWQWLFGDSLPTNRQVGIRDLFDFFWSVEQGHMNCRRVYVLDFRPFAAFIRPDATSTAVEWIYHYGPGAVHRPVRDRGWWRCKSSLVPGHACPASTTTSFRRAARRDWYALILILEQARARHPTYAAY